ncbi:hypothetical protein JR316_0006421 [Psilocybe cubensis]|uniref:Uncharacterized protein n=1 Tax=Psilocybe cubensis TaxID=181762 RepID=A0ACB8H221_PSICU|nr:hypothetical protein JR316_0006421 [Psilocybe cubensis]KAH9481891.1 hypothetical protein JR316_0006421 [Psilocybe cubensis]
MENYFQQNYTTQDYIPTEQSQLFSQDPIFSGQYDGFFLNDAPHSTEFNFYIPSAEGESYAYTSSLDNHLCLNAPTIRTYFGEERPDIFQPGIPTYEIDNPSFVCDKQQDCSDSGGVSPQLSEPSPSAHGRAIIPDIHHSRYTTVGLPFDDETEDYLRGIFGIPPDMPLNLDSLPNIPKNAWKRPKELPTVALASLAIWAAPNHRAKVTDIYKAVLKRFPILDLINHGAFRTSIRHTLSLFGMFRKDPESAHHGGYWLIDVRYELKKKRATKRSKGESRKGKKAKSDLVIP